MSNSSPNRRASSSPGSSIGEEHSTPPPITIPPEIRIFQKENGSSEKELLNNNEHSPHMDPHQTPSLNKKSFCIDALLAKSQSEIENIKRTQNNFVNNNYKDNVISRDLNSSPDDNLSR
jgi:hypothetical protein